jgi:hypothetical protein
MGPILSEMKRRGEFVDMSERTIPPAAATEIMKVNNNVRQPVSTDSRGEVQHDPLSLGSRTPRRDELAELLTESKLDGAVRTLVENAGGKYTSPPERSTTVSPELKAAADRLVAATPLLNKAAEMAARRTPASTQRFRKA